MPSITRNGASVGVFVAIGNFFIFQHFLGNSVADIKYKSGPLDEQVESMERTALYWSIGFTGITSLLVGSMDTALVGGVSIVVMDFAYKHANAVHPNTGKMASPAQGQTAGNESPMPDYSSNGSYASVGG